MRRESFLFLHFLSWKGLCCTDAPSAMHPTARHSAALSCPSSLPCENFPGTTVRLTLHCSYVVAQSHGHPTCCYIPSCVFELVPPAGRAPSAAAQTAAAPSACGSFPGFSLSSPTLQAASFCWQHPDSFCLSFVSWSSCNQSLL